MSKDKPKMKNVLVKNDNISSKKDNISSKKDNIQKNHIIGKKQEIKLRHKTEKQELQKNFKKLKLDLKLEYKKNILNNKNNQKDYFKIKKIFVIKSKEIKNGYMNNFNILKSKQILEKNNLKIELLNYRMPMQSEKSDDKINNLLLAKQKEKRNKLLIEKNSKNYKTIFKNLPIRLFKEIRRVRWVNSNAKIGVKFLQVLILIICCALFIWAIELGLSDILKLLKITMF